MKKQIGMYAFMAVALLSCGKDDDGAGPILPPEAKLPSVTVLEEGYDQTTFGVVGAPQNGAVIFTVEATAEDGFKSLDIFKIVNDIESEYETLDVNSPDYVQGNVQTYGLNYILSAQDVGNDLEFKAVVTDQNNATAEIYFGAAQAKSPLLHFPSVELKQSFPIADFDGNTDSFLHLDGADCEGISLVEFFALNYSDKIAMVYSVNDGSGFYLGSPKVVNELESNVTSELPTLATTKFKVQEEMDWDTLDIYQTFELSNAHEEAQYNSHEQKMEGVNEVGKMFSFKTDDGRIGMVKILEEHNDAPEVSIKMELYVTQ